MGTRGLGSDLVKLEDVGRYYKIELKNLSTMFERVFLAVSAKSRSKADDALRGVAVPRARSCSSGTTSSTSAPPTGYPPFSREGTSRGEVMGVLGSHQPTEGDVRGPPVGVLDVVTTPVYSLVGGGKVARTCLDKDCPEIFQVN